MPGTRRVRLWFGVVVFLVGFGGTALLVAAGEVEVEYARRVKKLAPDDVEGHFELAMWCKEQRAWTLLRKECTHVLLLEPDHQQARLLLELAKANLTGAEEAGETRPAPEGGGGPAQGEMPRLVTDDEIQILRRAELSCNVPERVAVKFNKDVVRRYASEMIPDPDERRLFYGLSPAEKAQEILCAEESVRKRFAKDIFITSDPQRFRDFERQVLPIIERGCATANCHGGPDAGRFRLYTGRHLSPNEVYTDYLLLIGFERGNEKMINRSFADRSLLLHYGLKDAVVDQFHPSRHPTEIEPVYPSTSDRDYVAVQDWIQTLDVIPPEYGINLTEPPAAKSAD
jgi:hypothetical protein